MDPKRETRVKFNRASRALWIEDGDNRVLHGPEVAAPGVPMHNAAGIFLSQHGYLRKGDFMLVASKAPLREAVILPLTSEA